MDELTDDVTMQKDTYLWKQNPLNIKTPESTIHRFLGNEIYVMVRPSDK